MKRRRQLFFLMMKAGKPAGFTAFLLAFCVLVKGCASEEPDPAWIEAFGYAPAQVHPIDVGKSGFPYVPVTIADTRVMLPFDTGNMVGVSVSSVLFDRLELSADESWDRLNSAGRKTASLRVSVGVNASLLGKDLGPIRVFELDDPQLDGLVGPTVFGGGHFTLDYASRMMALGATSLPANVEGFHRVPLVRSASHPRLVLVKGAIGDRPVLLELDTGKSRTVVNPDLASELNLKRARRGVEIKGLRLGGLEFDVPSAKEVDQTGIDPDLPEPIMAGVGSDILSRFTWTVDYETGVLWIPASPMN